MATQTPPKRGTAYTTYCWLISQSNPLLFQTSVTLAAGDVTVSKDGGAFNNITTLPTEIGTTGCLAVSLSAAEMTADTVAIRFRDAAGDEWCDLSIVLHTAVVEIDDLPTATEIADAVLSPDGELLRALLTPINKPTATASSRYVNQRLNLWLAGTGSRVMEE